MKKWFCFGLVMLALFGCLTACSFTQNMSGAVAGEAQSAPMVEKMMNALAEERISDAKALMHPQVTEKSNTAITQMSEYLDGRKASSLEQKTINVKTSTGTSGNTRQEQVTYKVTLTDDDVIYLNVLYLSNSEGKGFNSFQIVLGVA